jgi:hypothetical protein
VVCSGCLALDWQAREVSKRTGMLVDTVDENVSENLPEAETFPEPELAIKAKLAAGPGATVGFIPPLHPFISSKANTSPNVDGKIHVCQSVPFRWMVLRRGDFGTIRQILYCSDPNANVRRRIRGVVIEMSRLGQNG